MVSTASLYFEWEYTAESDSAELVFPDGCRDILILENEQSGPELRITDWDDRARLVVLTKGEKISGFRLRPGVSFCQYDIERLDANAKQVQEFIESSSDTKQPAIEMIEAMGDHHKSLPSICGHLGVSARTLQRHLKKLGLPNPEYWRLLSRARNAANALSDDISFAETASSSGYSDQSHMTRELGRWFGMTPGEILQNTELLADISQPGLGNWTLEQISIK